jgi:hypothetical protein
MNNDSESPNNETEKPPERLSVTSMSLLSEQELEQYLESLLTDQEREGFKNCPEYPIAEEFMGTIEELQALDQKEKDLLAWNGPEFVPLPLRSPRT